ncbi:hypothetical protein J6590_035638 [Homalodisca vitripennis]|nr:hypothetical protein J6590_035638 [Homalodisca vitripennis]
MNFLSTDIKQLNKGTNDRFTDWLELVSTDQVTSEPPAMAGQASCFQGQDRSAVTHPSSNHAQKLITQ